MKVERSYFEKKKIRWGSYGGHLLLVYVVTASWENTCTKTQDARMMMVVVSAAY